MENKKKGERYISKRKRKCKKQIAIVRKVKVNYVCQYKFISSYTTQWRGIWCWTDTVKTETVIIWWGDSSTTHPFPYRVVWYLDLYKGRLWSWCRCFYFLTFYEESQFETNWWFSVEWIYNGGIGVNFL